MLRRISWVFAPSRVALARAGARSSSRENPGCSDCPAGMRTWPEESLWAQQRGGQTRSGCGSLPGRAPWRHVAASGHTETAMFRGPAGTGGFSGPGTHKALGPRRVGTGWLSSCDPEKADSASGGTWSFIGTVEATQPSSTSSRRGTRGRASARGGAHHQRIVNRDFSGRTERPA